MIDINYTLFIQMANFLIFLILMNCAVPSHSENSSRKKEDDLREAGTDRSSGISGGRRCEYDKKLQDSRSAGFQKIQELKAAGNEQEKEILARISEQAAVKVQEMRGRSKRDRNCSNGVESMR